MSQRFKCKSEKFSGKIGDNIEEFFQNYDIAVTDYSLSEEQKKKYLHNLFDEEAKRFYRSIHNLNDLQFDQIKSKMVNEYNNITRQNRVRQYLQGLKLSEIIQKESCDISTGLERIREIITKYTPNGPEVYRNDPSKVEYLYNAVLDQSWASSVLTNRYANTPPWSFNQLCMALDSTWLQEDRKKGSNKELEPTQANDNIFCLLYTSPSPRDQRGSRMPSSA